MKQFEYINLKSDRNKEDLNILLNRYGGQGWELVFYDKVDGEIIFKREK